MERNLLLKGASLSTDRGILPQGDVLVAGGVIRAVAEALPCATHILHLGHCVFFGTRDEYLREMKDAPRGKEARSAWKH